MVALCGTAHRQPGPVVTDEQLKQHPVHYDLIILRKKTLGNAGKSHAADLL
jgi:hypothetical protein